MRRQPWLRALGAVVAGCVLVGCSAAIDQQPPAARPQTPPATTPVAAKPPEPAPVDPVPPLMAASEARFTAGVAELNLGHLSRAKAEFNAAIDVLLESPAGARSDPRLRDYLDRLVDRISAFEMRSLAEGDGFAEKPTEPASLDELLAQPVPDAPTSGADLRDLVAADLEKTAHDVPIPLNAKVLSWIEVFQGRLRGWFQATLQRGMPYLPMIQNTFRAEGLPLDLAYIPICESAFTTNALSRASAKGFWQLMRGTAVDQGLAVNWYIDERSNPEKATVAAAKYLKTLGQMFDGDWHMALASYNGGPGFIQRTSKKKGQSDFWELAGGKSTLPRETREYVPMVLASMVIARNPQQYGFTFDPVAPPEYETVSLTAPVDLRKVAEWAGVAVDDIQRLNPELRRFTTPVREEPYGLRVPAGTAKQVEQRIAETPPEELASLQWYTVRRGESLTSIANKLKVRRTDLVEANGLKTNSAVTPDQKLVVPRSTATAMASRADRPAPAATAKPAPPPVEAVKTKVTYSVKKGDTLSSIAQQFHTTVAQIKTWNGLKSDRLSLGTRLTIYTSKPR